MIGAAPSTGRERAVAVAGPSGEPAAGPAVLQISAIGDQLLALPALRAITTLFPAGVRLLLGEGMLSFFYRNLPIGEPVRVRWDECEDRRWDRVATAAGPCGKFIALSRNPLPFFADLARRLGAARSIGRSAEFDIHVRSDPVHVFDQLFAIPRALDPSLRFDDFAAPPELSPAAEAAAARFVAGVRERGARMLFVHPESRSPGRTWPGDRFPRVVGRFLDDRPGWVAVVSSLAPLDRWPRSGRILHVDCHLELALAIAGHADLFLGVDSSFLHAADLFRTPGVALFGPTKPEHWGFRLSPRHRHVAAESMDRVREDDVLAALDGLAGEVEDGSVSRLPAPGRGPRSGASAETRPDVAEAAGIDGWMSEAELAWLAGVAKGCRIIVEIGSWKGRSTKALAMHTGGVVYAIDDWRGDEHGSAELRQELAAKGPDGVHAEFLRNLEPEIRAGRVVVLRRRSAEAAPVLRELLGGRGADLVFIDAEHTRASVKHDIETYRPFLREGGLLAGHDYSGAWPGVVLAVDELVPGRTVIPDGTIWHARCPAEAPDAATPLPETVFDLEEMAARRLERLGDSQRVEGRLDEARGTFARLLALAPGHAKAARILASLEGRKPSLPAPFPGPCPAPFARFPGFLPAAVHDRILESLVAIADRFEPAPIGRLDACGNVRLELAADARRSAHLPDCFRHLDPGLGQSFREELHAVVPAILERLQVLPFEPDSLETRALRYGDGDFFRAHRDSHPWSTKRITLVCYMHAAPRPFSGGDLLLYDTWFRPELPPEEDPGFLQSLYTRLTPAANELICFPSAFYHEVLPVGGTGGDRRRARMAISGWLHAGGTGGGAGRPRPTA